MSHVRRAVALILLGFTGWLAVTGTAGAVVAPDSASSRPIAAIADQVCC
jgi:hypothetical protein